MKKDFVAYLDAMDLAFGVFRQAVSACLVQEATPSESAMQLRVRGHDLKNRIENLLIHERVLPTASQDLLALVRLLGRVMDEVLDARLMLPLIPAGALSCGQDVMAEITGLATDCWKETELAARLLFESLGEADAHARAAAGILAGFPQRRHGFLQGIPEVQCHAEQRLFFWMLLCALTAVCEHTGDAAWHMKMMVVKRKS